jgi:hypothetical protein
MGMRRREKFRPRENIELIFINQRQMPSMIERVLQLQVPHRKFLISFQKKKKNLFCLSHSFEIFSCSLVSLCTASNWNQEKENGGTCPQASILYISTCP